MFRRLIEFHVKVVLRPKNNSFFSFGFENYVNEKLTDSGFKF